MQGIEIRVHDTGEVPAESDERWSTAQLQEDFDVLAFLAPRVIVRRKSDGVKGSLQFTHSPRLYFDWIPSE